MEFKGGLVEINLEGKKLQREEWRKHKLFLCYFERRAKLYNMKFLNEEISKVDLEKGKPH